MESESEIIFLMLFKRFCCNFLLTITILSIFEFLLQIYNFLNQFKCFIYALLFNFKLSPYWCHWIILYNSTKGNFGYCILSIFSWFCRCQDYHRSLMHLAVQLLISAFHSPQSSITDWIFVNCLTYLRLEIPPGSKNFCFILID